LQSTWRYNWALSTAVEYRTRPTADNKYERISLLTTSRGARNIRRLLRSTDDRRAGPGHIGKANAGRCTPNSFGGITQETDNDNQCWLVHLAVYAKSSWLIEILCKWLHSQPNGGDVVILLVLNNIRSTERLLFSFGSNHYLLIIKQNKMHD